MKKVIKTVGTVLGTVMLFGAMSGSVYAKPLKIGFSIDDLRLERWTKDRDYFIDASKKLGADVVVASADASSARQISQIQNFITSGVDAIVIVPFNGKVLSSAVADAKAEGIPVISYDRLISNADVDAYITFDNEKVGEMQASELVKVKPKGNYYLLGGSPTDSNAYLLRKGQEKVLKPYVDKGDITIVGKQWTKDWMASEALNIIENALTRNQNKIDAVVASNDNTAGGAIQALQAQGLNDVVVSGQDADLAGVMRVANGTQTMTVYKPLKEIASKAAELAVNLVNHKEIKYSTTLNNDYKDVNTILLSPTAITKDNVDLLVKDGVYTKEQLKIK
ncbi:MAG: D-xylose ABC transporter substrate-binding protein [Vibrio sp.]